MQAKNNNNKKKNKKNKRKMTARVFNRQKKSLPAATGIGFNKRFYVDQLTATQARVSGSDLVYAIPDSLTVGNSTNVITMIPCNPAYWIGTRISALAAGYQNYRPIKFDVHYVPQCAMTQQGNVLGGTIWHDAPPITNLQQTLRTSNGGLLTQAYKPGVSRIKVGANLQYNLYRMAGDINDQSMPFFYIAIAVACKNNDNQRINPGYFYVDYTFLFKNPTGFSTVYTNSGLTTFLQGEPTMRKSNMIAILCSALVTDNFTLDIGAKLDIEYDSLESVYNFMYNGTEVPSPANAVWLLSNGPSTSLTRAQMEAQTKLTINYFNERDVDPVDGIKVMPSAGITYQDSTNNNWYTLINTTNMPVTLYPEVEKVFYLGDTTQNFGEYVGAYDGVTQFLAPLLRYTLKQFQFAKVKPNIQPPFKHK